MADAVIDFPAEGSLLCIEIPTFPDPCAALLPGGAELQDPDLLRLVQPALAPMLPIFDLLEAIVAIKGCIEAIPDAISSVDPTEVTDCIPEMAEKVAALLKLLPQTSIPTMAKQLLNCIIVELLKVRRLLVSLQAQVTRIARVTERAAELEDAALAAIAVCATGRVATTLSNEMKALVAVGRLLGLLRTLLDLAGLDGAVPDLSSIEGRSLEAAIDPLDALIDSLRDLRDAVPDLAGALDPGDLV